MKDNNIISSCNRHPNTTQPMKIRFTKPNFCIGDSHLLDIVFILCMTFCASLRSEPTYGSRQLVS